MSECQTAPCRSVTFRGLEVTLLLVAPHMHAHTRTFCTRGSLRARHGETASPRAHRAWSGRSEPDAAAAAVPVSVSGADSRFHGRAGRSFPGASPGQARPSVPRGRASHATLSGTGSPGPAGRLPPPHRGACSVRGASLGLSVGGDAGRAVRPAPGLAGPVPARGSPGGRLHISYGVIFRFSDGYVAIKSFFYPLLLQHSMQSSLAH